MQDTDNDELVPWFRQPWVWFIIALPLTSVVASLYLVTLSITHQDDLVRDDWYKAGRAINQDMHAEQRARAMGLTGTLNLDPAGPSISVQIAGGASLPATLSLSLAHSTLAAEDINIELLRGADGIWHAALPRLPMGKRHLMLEPAGAKNLPEGERWRLRATDVIFQAVPVLLQPNG